MADGFEDLDFDIPIIDVPSPEISSILNNVALQEIRCIKLNGNQVKSLYLDNQLIYEQNTKLYDWYVMGKAGSNDFDGKTPETGFRDFTALEDVVENGDSVFVGSGTYHLDSQTTITKGITIEGDISDPPWLLMGETGKYILYFDLNGVSGQTVNIRNLMFYAPISGDRYLLRVNIYGNSCNVDNCSFENAYGAWDGRALDCRNMNGGSLTVRNCEFSGNNAYNYGHSAASCRAWGSSGTFRVYNCTFNNPTGSNMAFGGNKGRAICAGNGNSSCYIDARGKCNEFLGAGDTCYNYTEEECDDE
ncbi:MAG: hypothetical protein Q4P18_07320 [Methanobrevibacter sp.]|uniref:hypothetical protein n=1 Tax=Methanobrevibacter sp. TaxID=66852 RepID=UPI0026DF4025|nr:hypothetical protein [Methanobrevibacter sp.]MDO5849328.1 hypothetical protein [Methanobrevibacter sp.]